MKLGQFLNRQALKLMGIGFGVAVVVITAGAMTYAYAEEPSFCGGCHAMTDHYATWQASTHKNLKCSECHLPHEYPDKLVAKTETGVVDVYHQTLRDYALPQQIEITEKGQDYLRQNCLRCHEMTIANTSMISGDKTCTTCHRELVHDLT